MKTVVAFILSFFVCLSVFAQDKMEMRYFETHPELGGDVLINATAQNKMLLPEKYPGENDGFGYSDFEPPKLPAIKKQNQERWEPDTVYCFSNLTNSGIRTRRTIFEYHYHSQGLIAISIEQNESINSWTNIELSTYTYDSDDNLLTKLNQLWRNNSWVNRELSIYTYDSDNNRLTTLIQNWENNSWVNRGLTTYTYDSDNNRLTTLIRDWENNSWVNRGLSTYTYDSDNNRLTTLIRDWENNSWVNRELSTDTYDSDNNRLTTLFQNWENNSWVNSGLSTYTYDSDNNRLTELFQGWENNSWVNYRQYLRIYDENRNGISVEFWVWRNESWQPSYVGSTMISLGLYYNNMQSVFEMWNCDKLTASYINVADNYTAIANPPAIQELNAVSIYPNPTAGELRIRNYELRIEDVRIFDISGVNVLNTQQTTLDVSHLPAGIYFVQIVTEKGIVTKKIVKM